MEVNERSERLRRRRVVLILGTAAVLDVLWWVASEWSVYQRHRMLLVPGVLDPRVGNSVLSSRLMSVNISWLLGTLVLLAVCFLLTARLRLPPQDRRAQLGDDDWSASR